ncbi:esterase/lipase domain-containing protein [Phlyctema vagabunda]|uniref:Esterase/lipase domain-containing protein n=1 Tax=Phlyctema vagabunda TaxID=108571 RepID=A0ABR4P810_9HELO
MLPQISIAPVSTQLDVSYHLVFFITGNPGLVHYYDTFLSTLHNRLSDNAERSSDVFHIYGQNLAGFADEADDAHSEGRLFTLDEQIQILLEAIKTRRIPEGPRASQNYDSVILIGHSVGTYIILEILSHLRTSTSISPNIKASILLFPTVTHLAKSPSGLKFSNLFRIPEFPRRAAVLAKLFLWPFPRSALKWVVGLVARMPNDSAEVTTAFLTSRMGIHQALHLAKYEIEQITEDKWDEDIWGVEHTDDAAKSQIPKLIFYFGENDHWVANHTRDELIAARGQDFSQGSKPLMLIDQDGVDHGFCIRHSESIAEKVHIWIEDIIEGASDSK